ncbi:Eco57I restriction-modification methylase domain-containing protein [Cellulophaga tyrosinoxydans]|uniref:site-specific DNA-methyltransferase (adenine-specific) n=1 Tax=Cellulophaga tyrosinoxydans TaxID=504486 RepID=A0A1W1YYP8_9FLAO|nr:N-6 DNA methylase [Cellulophaga tyrosinoxydans]SMC41335.1 TaqI-like C-terminal specificity domain-containing protein [Cellulophaga tyrosinoxydans]
MALFQTSVLKNYLKQLDDKTIAKSYGKYVKYFFNTTIQENIRNSKEEQFQATFLNELFVSILGYTLNPNPEFNLTTEFKNQKNNRKADGAILKGENAIGVIELKGTNTKDLESIRKQAFDYKANQKGCVYVVTSNFEKLRFYINDATEFEEFDLFDLTEDRFKLLFLCLQKDNIINNLPLAVKESSLVEEEKITKRFYSDYSLFKRELYRDLVRRNATQLKNYRKTELQEISVGGVGDDEIIRLEKNVKLALFKKSQKLIDRFLFIFFSEDRGLLPPNSTVQILKKWKADVDFGDERPLYDLFKQYFNFLDKGRQGTTLRAEIYAYNGGLFKPDSVLDSLEIDNELLYKHALQLANYDFESQVDVNILGHIFENSLNEIESVNAEIEGADFDKQKSKRKKDGVFYTPKYITKYIVENTVGKLCEEKKVALGFKEEEYFKGRANRHKTKILELVELLDNYRAWLLELTICDPACGSGAFLNQALDFLIKEHNYLDELKAKILGGGLVFSDIENTILENNIFGVDLNEESVEIAKLSLWLRTAQPRRKLNDLSSNIKCGNSLIADKKGAGNKAFSWEQEFPKVFDRGGFDVVIGNPPYVKLETIKEQSLQLEKYNFETFDKRGDLYVLFVEKGFNILKPNGVLSYIMPNKWLQAGYGQPLRSYFLTKALHQLIDFGDIQIFQGATTYPIIFVASNNSPEKEFKVAVLQSAKATDFETNVSLSFESYKTSSFDKNTWVISSKNNRNLLDKLSNTCKTLFDFIGGKANYGIKTGLTEAFLISQEVYDKMVEEDAKAVEFLFPFLLGREAKPYANPTPLNYLLLFEKGFTKSKLGDCTEEEAWSWLQKQYPSIAEWLSPFEERAKKRTDKGDFWWELRACDYYSDFQKPKIMYQVLQVKPCFIYDEKGLYCNNSMWIIPIENKGLAGILNSKMGWWLITKYCTQIQNGCQLIWKYFGQVPIPHLNGELEVLVADMILLTKSLDTQLNGLLNLVKSKFAIEKFSNKLQSWHELDFATFSKELKKLKIQLSLGEESEWLIYFEEQKNKAQEWQRQLNQTNQEIDKMVYGLYGLTEEEIEIIENS